MSLVALSHKLSLDRLSLTDFNSESNTTQKTLTLNLQQQYFFNHICNKNKRS